MDSPNRRFSTLRGPLLWFVIVAGLVGLGVSARPLAARTGTWLGRSFAHSSPAAVQPIAVPLAQTQTTPRLVVVHVTADGFEPASLKVPKGETVFMIRNNSGQDNLSFLLTRPGQSPGAEGTAHSVPAGFASVKKQLNPGEVTLSEAKNPDWLCHITITE